MAPKRKKKDPNAPRKALTAFILYANDHRSKIRSDNPGIPFGDVAKKLSEHWKKEPVEVQAKYEDLAAQDKERYIAQKAEYLAQKALEPSGRKRKKDPDAPKHSLNPFMFFAQEMREKIKAELPEGERLNTVLGVKWRAMTHEEKKKYVDLSNEDRARYQTEKLAYTQKRQEVQEAHTAPQ